MSGRYAEAFERARTEGRGAFIPFTVLGFPSPADCGAQLELLACHGDALELGVPFSDPVADGPTIQRAGAQALRAGTTFAVVLELVTALRASHPDLPVGLLVYANLVVHRGIGRFYAAVAAAGVDSVLIADVPSEEGTPFAAAARAAGVAPVFVAPPNASSIALDRIARLGGGYTYILTRSGVTGVETAPDEPAPRLLGELAARGAPPPVLGFGISAPAQVAAGMRAGAAGVIAGSAVVDRLGRLAGGDATEATKAETWLVSMHRATRR